MRFPVIYNYKNKALQDALLQFLNAKIPTIETNNRGSSKMVIRICQTARSHILKDHNLKTQQQGATTPALPHIPSKREQG